MIRCRGFTNRNTDLDEAKKAIDKGWQNKSLSPKEIDDWVNQGGFLGWRIPRGYVVVDIDKINYATTIITHLESLGNCGVYKTPKGVHLIYKSGAEVKNVSHIISACGLEVDYRAGGKGYIIYPTANAPKRKILREIPEDVDKMPSFFNPIKGLESPLSASEGSRNHTLYTWYCKLLGLRIPEADKVIFFTNMLLDNPLEEVELGKSINSANVWWSKQGISDSGTDWDKKHLYWMKEIAYPLMSASNLKILLDKYDIKVKLNDMTHEFELNGEKVEDRHDVVVKDLAQEYKFKGVSMNTISQYLDFIGHENIYHPVKDYIDGLTALDSTTELKKLCDTLEYEAEEDREFSELLIKRWLISTIAAVYNPQFSSQGVLTLQGEGGIRKSTWLRQLSPIESSFIGEFIGFDVHDKDDVAKATKAWIVELAELESTMKKDYISLKGYITSVYDEYRAAYARRLHKHKRKTVYCASVNSVEFLKDDTGNRRFWVLGLKTIDTDTKLDLDKLWGEIKYLYFNNERYFLDDTEASILKARNLGFSVTTTLDGGLLNLLDLTPGYPQIEITATGLMPILSQFARIQMSPSQIGIALNKLGLTRIRKRINGKPTVVYNVPLNSAFIIKPSV